MVCAFLMLVGQWLVLGFEDRPMKADPQELIDRIRKDPYLNRDEKSQLIDSLRKTKHYGLVWEKKPEEVEENQRNRIPVLTEVRERAIVSEAADAPNHILIEGDNLDALVALTYTHEGKIDVIYIDPPYNTGNKDFIYNDCFVDKESPYRHSLWLSFMSRRLKIAKRLLSDKGVIFISIDDNEQAQLKLLCDEVFGERSFVSQIIWRKKTGALDAKGISTTTEYILTYCKSDYFIDNVFTKDSGAYDEKRFKYQDEYYESRGPFYFDTLDRGGLRYSDSLNYPILLPNGKQLYPHGRETFVNDGWTWKWGKEKVEWGLKHGFIDIQKSSKNPSGYSIRYKVYMNVDNEGNAINRTAPHKNLINDILNADAAAVIKNIFGDNIFKYSKPIDLILRLISYVNNLNATILDFFAGSGTTLHATMALNAEDGGRRQCILVTNNENRICEEVTYVRNKKVIEGYVNAKGETVKGLTTNSLRYYKTDFIDRDKTAQNRRALSAASADLLRIREDSYNELDHFGSLKLKPSVARYFTGNGRHILLILNENAIEYFVNEIKDMGIPAKFKVYVFSPGDYAYDDEFTDVADRVELCAVPSSVYNAYEKVLPKRVRDVDEEESDDFAENGGDGFLGDARNFEDQGEEKSGQNENDVEE